MGTNGVAKRPKVLLIGANGFLGRQIATSLQATVHRLVCLGRQVAAREKGLTAEYVSCDIHDTAAVAEVLRRTQPDLIVYSAGAAHRQTKSGEHYEFFEGNVKAVECLARALDSHKFRGGLVFVSTVAAFRTACQPGGGEWTYGGSKRASEKIILRICRKNGINLRILRFGTLYGENDVGNVASLIQFIRASRGLIGISSNGVKTLLYVGDAARAVVAACVGLMQERAGNAKCKLYTICGESATSTDLTESICSVVRGRRPALSVSANLASTVVFVLQILCVGACRWLSLLHRKLQKICGRTHPGGNRFSSDTRWTQSIKFREWFKGQGRFVKDSQANVCHFLGGRPWQVKVAKRLFDIAIAGVLIGLFFLPMLGIAVLVRSTTPGPALYWSRRVGRCGEIFWMPKFRTMFTSAPEVETRLLGNSAALVTTIGKFLRKSSLDELPQLFCVFCGDMSLVGPRPALWNQHRLIQVRRSGGVNDIAPGITGLAQVRGRDEISDEKKIQYDRFYRNHYGIFFDLRILFETLVAVVQRRGVVEGGDSGATQEMKANALKKVA
jgi:O-antigen biosynthesis protein WbqP